jgi:hypothetical protein
MMYVASPGPTPSHPIPAVQDEPVVEKPNEPVEEPEEPRPPAVEPDKPAPKRMSA